MTACCIAGDAPLSGWAATNQAAGSDDQTPSAASAVKPGTDAVTRSGKPAVDPKAPLPPVDANADARELVKRRMEVCRQRPEICEQKGENRNGADARQREGTSKD
jgi:hypothetical protein